MSNSLLARPLRPLSASALSGSSSFLRGSTAITTAATTTTTNTSTQFTPAGPSLTQCRHESTTRRMTKLHRLPGAPAFQPPASRTQDHIVYNPPSAMPNVLHTPTKFLPPGDRRRELAALTARLTGSSSSTAAPTIKHNAFSPITATGTPLSAPSFPATRATPANSAALPPPVRKPYEKKYHLTEADIEEIRRLRSEDPALWTRERLAKKFDCSNFFVGLIAPAPERGAAKAKEVEEKRKRWGRRKREAKEDRVRRREMWGRDV